MKNAIGVNDFLAKVFKQYAFEGKFKASFGEPERNFRMLITGLRKHGKTGFCVQFCKYFTQFGSVFYNSFEEGISKSLQDALKRNNMHEVAGKIMFGHKETFAQTMSRLKKRKPRLLVLDSLDYMNLTAEQYKQIVDTCPRMAVIIICWSNRSGEPRSTHAQEISFMVDIVLHVKDFIAYPVSRFGGNEPYQIKEKVTKPGQQLTLLQ